MRKGEIYLKRKKTEAEALRGKPLYTSYGQQLADAAFNKKEKDR